ncbi:hypothetical protein [Pajaroellobacter abortibovis]|uniref:Uncharacterized protein n=1 Tax=Pajaroellobacter abortibovis TaxID=1882918 RepID=A0A1L6MYC3_9BACT|nr:hypothetical protein [Pajaroellobacter abortibovis]APS00408.1 hypothetical protein BCY86_06735 [Pajaroellobacter abortibovis]
MLGGIAHTNPCADGSSLRGASESPLTFECIGRKVEGRGGLYLEDYEPQGLFIGVGDEKPRVKARGRRLVILLPVFPVKGLVLSS